MPGAGSRQGNDSGARPGQSVIAVFDLDRTITQFGTYTPFLFSVARRRPLRLLLAVPLAIAALAYKLGMISRKRLKEHMLCAVLCGAERVQVAGYATAFTARWAANRVRPGALTAIDEHRSKGHYLILATASLDLYVERFGIVHGFGEHRVFGFQICRFVGPAVIRPVEGETRIGLPAVGTSTPR